jgi:CRP-like cAMP-binding protein
MRADTPNVADRVANNGPRMCKSHRRGYVAGLDGRTVQMPLREDAYRLVARKASSAMGNLRSDRDPGATEPVSITYPLMDKLAAYAPLSEAERAFLLELHATKRRITRHREIVVAGRPYEGLLILCEGVIFRYKILADGKRQILGLGLPGDLIGFPACLFNGAVNSVSTVTDVIIAPVPFARLFELFRRFPRLGVALFWASAQEAAIYSEHLVNLGRRNAYQRLAHLILEMHVRLRAVGRAEASSYCLPLTQDLLADALGLTGQHVNRMIRCLREEELVTIEDRRVVIHNATSLAIIAGFEDQYLMSEQIPGLN